MSRSEATKQSALPTAPPPRGTSLSGDATAAVDIVIKAPRPPPAPPSAARPHAPTLAVPGVSKFAAGSTIAGKYELVRLLGQGGMGSVWVAKNLTIGSEVALKLVRSDVNQEGTGVADRMLQEARAAASIGHPAIARVFDFGFAEAGDPYIVMELLSGESLARAMSRRTKIAATRAVQTLLPIIDAVASAHSLRIVHRDLKPENIFLARLANGRLEPKVLDFGIAKLDRQDAERITTDGTMIGSPAYMSPEQVRGQLDVDARSDIWSLAVVLYEMLTGTLPFAGEGMHAMILAVVSEPPTPLLGRGVDEPELWKILACALEKDRQARFDDMRSFGRALAKWLLDRSVEEDVCGTPLVRWTVERTSQRAMGLSFFPSANPEPPELSERGEPPSSDAQEFEHITGIRTLARTLDELVASGAASAPRYWLIATVGSAVVAFLIAVIWGLTSGSPDAAAAAASTEDSAPAAQTKIKRAKPRASAPVAASSAEPAAESVPADESKSAPAQQKPTARVAPRRNYVARPAKAPELKNPFQ
jgi:eukaryotic-like serine/threonine-protein kinase